MKILMIPLVDLETHFISSISFVRRSEIFFFSTSSILWKQVGGLIERLNFMYFLNILEF